MDKPQKPPFTRIAESTSLELPASVLLSVSPKSKTEQRFRVEAELGRGGMGVVQRVVDTTTGHRLALKRLVLNPEKEYESQVSIAFFEQEFHVLSQLNHPCIIRVYDYGRDTLGPYYTMELLDGKDLRTMSPVPWQKACQIGRDIVSSLAILHSRGLVHRDVTPRNILVDISGNAKLVDFGAMCPIGVPNSIAGTPPFMAPETVNQATIDGRTDLFALGATLYFCITGQLAFPARRVRQLQNAWRSPPPPLIRYDKNIPNDLSELVLDLLAISPVARPQNDAEVFERIVAIGALPRIEALEVRSAYLASPPLVGRQELLGHCGNLLRRSLRGHGTSLLIEGDEGVGRSRVLDMIVLGAKILGTLVLRADAVDASVDFGVLKRLMIRLIDARPELDVHDRYLKLLIRGEPIPNADREATIEAFITEILDYTSRRSMVVAIDNVDMIDEPSLAGIASLAGELAKRRLFLVTTSRIQKANVSDAAVKLLSKSSHRQTLEPLTQKQVREMVGSVFGKAHNLDVLADVLFRHANGHPSCTMVAAQTLVDAKVVRYGSGSWAIPTTAEEIEKAIPKDPGLRTRLTALSDDAQELALILALDTHRHLRLADCVHVTEHRDLKRLYNAVDELVEARILSRRNDTYAFVSSNYPTAISLEATEMQSRGIHLRLARWYEQTRRSSIQAHHASCAQDWSTVERLAAATTEQTLLDAWHHDPTAIETFERLIKHRMAQDISSPDLARLRCHLLTLCQASEDWLRVVQHGPQALVDLSDRCGLTDYKHLSQVPVEERLSKAVAAAKTRYAEKLTRVGIDPSASLPLEEALRLLPTAILSVATSAVLAVDPSLTEDLPSLQPFYPLSAAFPIVDRLRCAIVALCEGRIDIALRDIRKVHGEVIDVRTDLDQSARTKLYDVSLSFLQGIEATTAHPAILERAEISQERNPKRAERERYAYYTAVGDVNMATFARTRLERLEVQGGTLKYFPTAWETELSLYLLTFNLEGLKRCEREAERTAQNFSGWKPRVELARIGQALCSHSTEETVSRAEDLYKKLRQGSSDRRYAFYLLAYGLLMQKRYDDCRAVVQSELDLLGRVPSWHEGYLLLLAIAEANLGNRERARTLADQHIAMYLEAGVGGVLLGHMYENMATIDLLVGDRGRFREHAQLCAAQYRNGFNPALTSRYEALMRKARHMQVAVSDELDRAARYDDRSPVTELLSIFRTELSTYTQLPNRFRQVLQLIVERSKASGGVLYLASEAGLRQCASTGDFPTTAGMETDIRAFWESETQPVVSQTLTIISEQEIVPGDSIRRCVAADGKKVHLFVLSDGKSKNEQACGVLALATRSDREIQPDFAAIFALSQIMLEEESVIGFTLE